MLMVVRAKRLLIMRVCVICFRFMQTLMLMVAIVFVAMCMDMLMAVGVIVRMGMHQLPVPMFVRVDVAVTVLMPVAVCAILSATFGWRGHPKSPIFEESQQSYQSGSGRVTWSCGYAWFKNI